MRARRTEPRKSLLRGSRYVPALHTNIRATLDAERLRLRLPLPQGASAGFPTLTFKR